MTCVPHSVKEAGLKPAAGKIACPKWSRLIKTFTVARQRNVDMNVDKAGLAARATTGTMVYRRVGMEPQTLWQVKNRIDKF
jgi:hypothetical protein